MRRFLCVALVALTSCLTLANTANTHYESALQAHNSGAFDEAYIHIKNTLNSGIDNVAVTVLYARILSDKGRFDEANTVFQKSLADGADPNLFVDEYLETLFALADYDDIQNFTHLRKLNNDNKNIWILSHARACILSADLACARTQYQTLIDKQDIQHQALNGLALSALIDSKYEQAIIYANKALGFKKNAESHRILGQSYKAQSKFSLAIDQLQQAFALAPDDHSVIRNLVDLLIAQGNLDQAWRSVESILEKTPNDLFAAYTKALIASRQGKQSQSDDIIAQVSEQLDSFPKEAFEEQVWLQYLRGMISLLENKHEEAQVNLQRYLFIAEKDVTAALYLARSYIVTGKAKQALNTLEPYEELIDTPAASIFLGQMYAAQNKLHKAIRVKERLLALYPSNESVQLFDIQIKVSRGKLNEAYQQALELNSRTKSSSQVRRVLAFLEYQLGKLGDAKNSALNILQVRKDDIEMMNIVAAYYINRNELSVAKTYLEQAVLVAPDHAQSLSNLALIAKYQNNIVEAERLVDLALQSSPSLFSAILLKTRLLLDGDKADEALLLLTPYVRDNGANADLHTLLVESYTKQQNLDQAFDHLQILKALQANNKGVLLQSIWIGYRLGKVSSLTNALEAVSLDDINQSAHLKLLAQLHSTAGAPEMTSKVLKKAAVLFPTDLDVQLDLFTWLISQRELEQAEALSVSLSNTFKENPRLIFVQAELQQASGQFKAAVMLYKKTLSLDKNYELALGKIFMLLGNGIAHRDFEQYLSPLVEQFPDRYFYRNVLAQFHYYHGSRDLALVHYERLLDKSPSQSKPGILNRLAQITYTTNVEHSEGYLRQGLALSPDTYSLQKSLGILLVETRRFQEGLSWLRKSHTQQSDDSVVLYFLASALAELDRINEANRYLDDILDNYKQSPVYERALSLREIVNQT